MWLLKGEKISEEKIRVESCFNLDFPENDVIDKEGGAIVEEQIEYPPYEIGKGYVWYANPLTSEQWLEEVEVPLTPEEQTQALFKQQQAIIDQLVLDSLGGEA
jgi:hypothetical protein